MKLFYASPVVSLFVALLSLQAYGNDSASSPSSEEVFAVVNGKDIVSKDRRHAAALVWRALMDGYARGQQIQVLDEEIDSFMQAMQKMQEKHEKEFQEQKVQLEKELEDKTLTEEQRKQKQEHLSVLENILDMDRKEKMEVSEEQMLEAMKDMGKHIVLQWKINLALYRQYGGRVIFQQAGFEPFDAYKQFLQEQVSSGGLRFTNKELEKEFWIPFSKEPAKHFIVAEDKVEYELATPWWLRVEEEE